MGLGGSMSAICAQAPSVHNAPTSTKREPDFVAIGFVATVFDIVFMCSSQGMATCSMLGRRILYPDSNTFGNIHHHDHQVSLDISPEIFGVRFERDSCTSSTRRGNVAGAATLGLSKRE